MHVVVDEKNVSLSLKLKQLVIGKGRQAQRFPLKKIKSIEIKKDCTFDSRLFMHLFQADIQVAFDIGRREPVVVQKSSIVHTKLNTKSAWFDVVQDEKIKQALARRIVLSKIKRQAIIINRLATLNHAAHLDIQAVLDTADLIDIPINTEIDKLMGYEGRFAKLYFRALRHFMPTWSGFDKRVKQPPTDPANAVLSYTYVKAQNLANKVLIKQGFDSMYGVLHQNLDYRPSLSCDLIERYRAIIDYWCVYMLHQHLRPEYFEVLCNVTGKIGMNKAGQGVFHKHYYLFQPVLERNIKRCVKRVKYEVQKHA